MKSYPTISKDIQREHVYAFDKLDGSNIRVEWTKKKGFHKFGTRTRLLGPNEGGLGAVLSKAYQLIREFDWLIPILEKQKWQKVTLFFELHGPLSFAGWHNAADDHQLTLIDVCVYKKGFLPPKDFTKLFDGPGVAQLLYYGKANADFVASVRSGVLDGMTFEGVVCKFKRKNKVNMFKVKSQDWLDNLRARCGADDKLFNQLV